MTRYSYKDFEIIFYAGYAVLCFLSCCVFAFLLKTRCVPENPGERMVPARSPWAFFACP